ncbi:camphor resistance protein CrcB [Micromonospora citrea]|uniref:Fluoride-specific ion channel FluC n=1 Tax=Micromonospora citrea TaxID=47855 RepID=A0A1C6TVS1_9ACTN|nr:CrcB family protein [Micromonospora citrea]SCL45769.1 camphor resistance protein CrcB [Micromonospora citrea]
MSGPDPRVDPDVDLRVPADRGELAVRPGAVLGAVAAGGALGALARAGLQHAFPHGPTGFPWVTFGVNLTGCLLIGVLMAALGRADDRRPLLRPFLGAGVLGGYTTFSTYAVDVHRALAAGAPAVALGYLAATLAGALVAVWLGDALAGRLLDAATGRPDDRATGPTDDRGGR